MVSRGNRIKDAPDFVGPPPAKKASPDRVVAAPAANPKTAPAAQAKRVTVQSPGGGSPSTLMSRLSPYAAEYQPSPSGGRRWNTGSPWGGSDSSSTWTRKKEFNAKESKKKGDLIVRPGFHRSLADGLHKVYCAPYMTVD